MAFTRPIWTNISLRMLRNSAFRLKVRISQNWWYKAEENILNYKIWIDELRPLASIWWPIELWMTHLAGLKLEDFGEQDENEAVPSFPVALGGQNHVVMQSPLANSEKLWEKNSIDVSMATRNRTGQARVTRAVLSGCWVKSPCATRRWAFWKGCESCMPSSESHVSASLAYPSLWSLYDTSNGHICSRNMA